MDSIHSEEAIAYPEGGPKDNTYTEDGRTTSIQREVLKRTVLMWRGVVERAVSIWREKL